MFVLVNLALNAPHNNALLELKKALFNIVNKLQRKRLEEKLVKLCADDLKLRRRARLRFHQCHACRYSLGLVAVSVIHTVTRIYLNAYICLHTLILHNHIYVLCLCTPCRQKSQ